MAHEIDPKFHRPPQQHRPQSAPSIWRAQLVTEIRDSDRFVVVRSDERVLWIDYALGRAIGEHAGARDIEARQQRVWDAALALDAKQRRAQRLWFVLGAVAGGVVYAVACAALHGMKG